MLLGVYTPDELQEAAPRAERDITPPASTAAGLNSLINSKASAQTDAETRDQADMLASFTEKMSEAKSLDELDLLLNGGTWPDGKKRPGARQVFTGEDLAKAEDVYNIRRVEMGESQ